MAEVDSSLESMIDLEEIETERRDDSSPDTDGVLALPLINPINWIIGPRI